MQTRLRKLKEQATFVGADKRPSLGKHSSTHAGDSFSTHTSTQKLSDDSLHEGRVEVLNEGAHEGHFLARVLEDDARILGLAAQAVGRHHHRQVVHVHFRDDSVFVSSKYLEQRCGSV